MLSSDGQSADKLADQVGKLVKERQQDRHREWDDPQ